MQFGSIGVGVTQLGNPLAAHDRRAFFDQDGTVVGVHRKQIPGMLNDDEIAVAARALSAENHFAISHRDDRVTQRAGQGHTLRLTGLEGLKHPSCGWPNPVRLRFCRGCRGRSCRAGICGGRRTRRRGTRGRCQLRSTGIHSTFESWLRHRLRSQSRRGGG